MNAEETPIMMRESVHQATRGYENEGSTKDTLGAIRTKVDGISVTTDNTSSNKTDDISSDGREETGTKKVDELMKDTNDGIVAKTDKDLDNIQSGENMKYEQDINNEPQQVGAITSKAELMSSPLIGQKRKSNTTEGGPTSKRSKSEVPQPVKKDVDYKLYAGLTLSEYYMKDLDYPRPDPSGKEGRIVLYGNHHGFNKGHCKRCEKLVDSTFCTKKTCDFHTERSKKYNRRQQPHGCCGRSYGATGCRSAPSHVCQDNLYLDLVDYKAAERKECTDEDHGVYAIDTESIHTKKGLEVCRVTVIDPILDVVYNEFCQPTSEVVDYNTIWSGITKDDLSGVTKTFEELREDMLKLFSKDTILVGHGLSHDLRAMKIIHDKIIDTLVLYPHPRGWPLKRSLKDIALTELHMRIQEGNGHDSKEDALVAMKLVVKKVRQLKPLYKT